MQGRVKREALSRFAENARFGIHHFPCLGLRRIL